MGILNPPWLETVIAGGLAGFLFILIFMKVFNNRSCWKTGTPDIGSGDTIILHEDDGQINSYAIDPELFDYIMNLHEKTITVKIRKRKIIEIR